MNTSIQNVYTNTHESLADLSQENPVLLVFLRHFGCIFCRQALTDISKRKPEIDSRRIELIFVHMASNSVADQYFEEYGLKGIKHVSSPNCRVYRDFGLMKGTFGQLFGFKTWIRGYEAKKDGISGSLTQIGDSLQMPGIFILDKGTVIDSYIHKVASDRPDYDKLISCCIR